MTDELTELNELQEEQPQPEPKKYYINVDWYDSVGRSFRAVAEKRFCASCKAKLGTETQERVPVIDPKTGRVVYEMQTVPFGSNPMSAIRSCCSRERGYITADTPVLESVFRFFLANANQPAELETIREELSQWFPLTVRSHGYSAELLQRLIEADDYYGLAEFNPVMSE